MTHSFEEVMDRAETGPIMSEHEFDLLVGSLSKKLTKEFRVKMNPEEIVTSDDGLVDAAFEASMQLFLDLGVYCLNTSRVMKFSEAELREALKATPSTVTFGEGKEQASMVPRRVEDRTPPFVASSAVGTPVPSSLYVKVVQSYAQEPILDSISGPSLLELSGRKVRSGTPLEVEAAIYNIRAMKEAAKLAGRPGLSGHNFVACAEKTAAIFAAMRPEFGVRPTDGLLVAALGEMKVDYERLNKVPFLQETGYHIGALYGPLMGGYAGGPAETAIINLAHHFLGLLVYRAQWHDNFPLNILKTINTTPEMLWLISIVSQALSRNTDIIKANSPFCAAGPCTEMITWELAAHSIAATVSGSDLNPAAPCRNKYPERCSGMEARIHAEVGHAVARAGLRRSEANSMVKLLLRKYQGHVDDAPLGKKFSECYDLETLKPSQEYLTIEEKLMADLERMGLTF
jgi:methylamine--corrinoid protein Co-methyltransferase